MNISFAEKINPSLENFDFDAALQIAEAELERLPITPFHSVLGRSLNHLTRPLASWIDNFYCAAKKTTAVCALYFELNEFDIHTDHWFIQGFAYEDCEFDSDDMDWLCDFTTDAHTIIGSGFYLPDYPDLQTAFSEIDHEKLEGNWTEEIQQARDWCEQIIIIRFMELMRNSHLFAKEGSLSWSDIPILFTEHEYDFIIKSE